MNRTRAILFTFVISGILLTACGGKESSAGHQHGADSERYETTASLTVMPEFLSIIPTIRKQLIARSAEDIIKEIKCYCGAWTRDRLS